MINYITERLKEKSTRGGLAMIAGGVCLFALAPYTHWVAIAIIAYGAYQAVTQG